jgi:PKD repeat protein
MKILLNHNHKQAFAGLLLGLCALLLPSKATYACDCFEAKADIVSQDCNCVTYEFYAYTAHCNSCSATIDWDDGNTQSINTCDIETQWKQYSHCYSSSGSYSPTLDVICNCNSCTGVGAPTNTIPKLPTPDFTVDTACVGNCNQMNDQSTNGDCTINTWKWDVDGDNNFEYTSQNPCHTYPSSGSYDITLEVEDDCGCTVSKTITNAAEVMPAPTANAGPDTSYCIGDSVQIGGSPTASGGSSPYSLNWQPTGDLSCTNCSNPIASPTSDQTYNVYITDDLGCSDTDDVVITVNSRPTPDFAADSACEGTSTNFSDLSTSSDGNVNQWNWTFGNNLGSSTNQNPSFTYPACGPEMQAAGANYKDVKPTEVVVDGNLVTSPAWPGHPKWLAAFLGVLGTEVTHL